jgi:peptidoglycan/xylan/chitin deacetylase (PgdA/CDA1 family)
MPTQLIRKLALRCADRLGVYHLLRRRRHGAIALAYHGVEERIQDPRIQGVHLPLSQFEQHVDYIARNFETISLTDLAERLEEGRGLDGRQVLMTFDDGYRNNLLQVAPVLRSAGIPFAVFICTHNVSTGRRFPTYHLRCGVYLTERSRLRLTSLGREYELGSEPARDHAVAELVGILKSSPKPLVERIEEEIRGLHSPRRWKELDEQFISDAPLNWEDVKLLHEYGVCIGSHGLSHTVLHDRQETALIRKEMRESRREIMRRIGTCDFFAYPNGLAADISARAVAELDSAGYRLGFGCIFGEIRPDSPRTLLPRIDADENLETLKFYLQSAYHPRGEHPASSGAVVD